MRRRCWIALSCMAPLWLVTGAARADEALWSLLKAGGQVVLMRHALTTPGFGDPQGMSLKDCSSQRNLSEEGRVHARRVGEVFRSRGIVVAQVIASPWCRCIETARLAFGAQPEVSPALGNLFGRADPEGRQVAQFRLLASRRQAAGNRLLVSHGSTILALTGISPAPAEMVVLTPQGGGKFTVAGCLEAPAR